MSEFTTIIPHLAPAGMVLARLTGVFIYAPILSSPFLPRTIRALLVMALTLAVYPALIPTLEASGAYEFEWTIWSVVPALGCELMMGLVLGFLAMVPMVGIQLAGHQVGQQFGMAVAQEADPNLGSNASVVGIILFYLALMTFLNLGGHRVILAVMLHSFTQVPIGAYQADLGQLEIVVGMLQSAFELAMRIAAPIICLMLLQTFSLGFVSRTAPSFNVLSLGFPLRVLLGMSAMIAGLSFIDEAMTYEIETMLLDLFFVFEGNAQPG